MQELRGNLTPPEKAAALAQFEHDPHCTVLLMDDTGAVGLDLSFVEYVFLMEPLVDAAQEQQIVSRAHRIGATATVNVEVLVMQVHTCVACIVAVSDQTIARLLSHPTF
jgi:SNF2 family DNA or RNA helicase